VNWILVDDRDFVDDGSRVRLHGRRMRHVCEVHRAAAGDWLRVGRLGGKLGRGRVLRLDDACLEMEVELDREPPPRLPLVLLLALPRPRVLRRILVAIASLGVEELVLINAWRVEKSFWESESLLPERIETQLRLGLELAGDTRLPRVGLARLFRPFVEDELPARCAGRRLLVAHPGAEAACPSAGGHPVTLAIGPEGGFVSSEIASLARAGFECVHLGGRIGARVQNVETAVPALIARLF